MKIPLPALAVALLLAGCSGPSPDSADAGPDVALSLDASANQTLQERRAMQFVGGHQEASMPLQVTFTQTEMCVFAAELCGASVKHVDLTPIVPADVPVELTIELTGDGNYQIQLPTEGVTLVRYSDSYDSGTYRIAAMMVRSSAGTVGLTLHYVMASVGSTDAAVLDGFAQSVSRAEVVPAYLPASAELRPGDTIRASGGGLEELVLFGPDGTAPLRASAAPFNLTVPDGYPVGTYSIVAAADEAVRLLGPDRPLTARQLSFVATAPVDVPANQAVTWEMALDNHPLVAGVVLQSKPTVDGMGVVSYPGNMDVALTTAGNVDVIAERMDCVVFVSCPMALLGSTSYGFWSGFLDERLVPGSYTGKVLMDGGRELQAYSWALVIA